MTSQKNICELPKNIEHYLATLSKHYAQEGKQQLQEVIVNAQIRVHEQWSFDNWNGGTYGHALYLILPEILFLRLVKQKDTVEDQIQKDVNRLHNIQNEFVEKVFLEMGVVEDREWRKESGLLMTRKRIVAPDVTTRIWENECFRIFFSHKSKVKKEATDLKEQLRLFGISCFVAHKDIRPTKEFQNEMENALDSMDGLVALMTADFHDSEWTDQEIGIAIGHGIPVVSIRLGRDPYGFIGKYQAILDCSWDDLPSMSRKIFDSFMELGSCRARLVEASISKFTKSESWHYTKWSLDNIFPQIRQITGKQENQMLQAYLENPQIHNSFVAQERLPIFLKRVTGKNYIVKDTTLIEDVPF